MILPGMVPKVAQAGPARLPVFIRAEATEQWDKVISLDLLTKVDDDIGHAGGKPWGVGERGSKRK